MEINHCTTVHLSGSIAAVHAALSDRDCLGWFGEELDLPIVGRRRQTVSTTPGVDFSCTGDAWSVSGSWRLEGDGGDHVRARLEVRCRVAESVAREAVDAYRSHSPLPIRTDADAILWKLVEDLFREKLAGDVDAYRQRVEAMLGRRAPA
jgi:hypothetical protein